MKVLLRKNRSALAFRIVATIIFSLTHIHYLKADELPGHSSAPIVDDQSSERLEKLLLEMGYSDVDVSACALQFRRKLPNQCPTEKPLSYWRSINLLNLDMKSITEVQEWETDGEKWYLFKVRPTRAYYSRSISIMVFKSLMKEKYPDSGWPFLADDTTPLIRKEFFQEFPSSGNMNWSILETCHGDSPDFDVDYNMTYDDKNLLSDFRSAFIGYSNSNSCSQERLK